MSITRFISAFGLAVIFSQISLILSADIVPVIIINGQTPSSAQSVDALRIISRSDFREHLSNIVGGSRPAIVVFKKEQFCVEDFIQEKPNLDQESTNYLPSVDSPLYVFEELESYNITTDEKPETVSDGQLVIIPIETLSTVDEIYTDLRKKNPKTIGVITGVSCSYSRSERTRRAIARDDSEVIAQGDRILFYSGSGIYYKTATATSFSILGQPTASSSSANESDSVRFDMTFAPANGSEVILRLQFTATASKYWYFESVQYEADSNVLTLMPQTSVYSPFGFSYHCAQDTIFYHNDTTSVRFTNLQVQIDPPTLADGSVAFGDGWDCVGFTTIPILTGIFVTAIMALIMIWALTMIMDIRTMDRFDDPKGKTITVAVSE